MQLMICHVWSLANDRLGSCFNEPTAYGFSIHACLRACVRVYPPPRLFFTRLGEKDENFYFDGRNRDFEGNERGGGVRLVVLRHRMISRVSRFVIAMLRGSRIGYRPDLIDASLRIYLTSLWSTRNAESVALIPYSLLEKKQYFSLWSLQLKIVYIKKYLYFQYDPKLLIIIYEARSTNYRLQWYRSSKV